jgi:S-methylmethionine-dependent homocysteine/selenocysteine methylase
MIRYDALMARIEAGETILIDGGTGTECELRGVPMLPNAWNGGASLSHPDILRGIHTDYLDAGARIIITNTFGTSRHALEDAGVADDFYGYNRRAAEICVEAREEAGRDDVLIGGGISNWIWTDRRPSAEEFRQATEVQAKALRDGGADLIMLEMMIDVDLMNATIEGSLTTGLPVWVGLTVGSEHGLNEDDVVRLRGGEPLVDALGALAGRPVDVLTIMHTDVDLVDGALDVVERGWHGPIGVYAHSGQTDDGTWAGVKPFGAAEYADYTRRWLERGVRVIGGCCGTTPAHVEAIRTYIAN